MKKLTQTPENKENAYQKNRDYKRKKKELLTEEEKVIFDEKHAKYMTTWRLNKKENDKESEKENEVLKHTSSPLTQSE